MRVAMIGTGYVGLVSGACFADFGHTVTCIDKDASKIEQLRNGGIPIYEPGLDLLVGANVRAGRLFFDTDAAQAVREADAVFIGVGTPSRRGDGYADLSYVYAAAEEIAGYVDGFTVVVTKSTVPVGTGDEIEAIFKRVRPDADVAIVSNPEFLREGAAIEDFKRPDRVVVGTTDERAQAIMRELYRPLYLNETPILFTSRRTSELIKYAANAYLALKITCCTSAPTCSRWPKASAWMGGSVASSCTLAPATAAPASRRTRSPSSAPPATTARRWSWWRPRSRSTTSASAPWPAR